jgi:hypothetical protein
MCLTFVSASCAYDFVLSLAANICVSSFDCQLTSISITCDLTVFGFKSRKGTNLESSIKDILKSCFLDLNEKEVENVNKSSQRVNKHVELWAKNAYDEWKFF